MCEHERMFLLEQREEERGNNRSESKTVHESSVELLKAWEEEKSACGPSNKNMKNKDLVSRWIKNEGNEPDVSYTKQNIHEIRGKILIQEKHLHVKEEHL